MNSSWLDREGRQRAKDSIKALNQSGIVPVAPDLPGLDPVASRIAKPEDRS